MLGHYGSRVESFLVSVGIAVLLCSLARAALALAGLVNAHGTWF